MPKTQDTEMRPFERDLLESVGQAQRGEHARVTTGEAIARHVGGRPTQEVHKQPVTLGLDPHVLAQWRANGKGWHKRAAKALRKAMPR
jgi:hypothetical protein